MTRTLYSYTFLSALITPGSDVTLTVPAGFVWVLRDIEWTIYGGTVSAGSVAVKVDEIHFAYRTFPSLISRSWSWHGRVPCSAGANIQTETFGGPDLVAEWTISGYQLTTP